MGKDRIDFNIDPELNAQFEAKLQGNHEKKTVVLVRAVHDYVKAGGEQNPLDAEEAKVEHELALVQNRLAELEGKRGREEEKEKAERTRRIAYRLAQVFYPNQDPRGLDPSCYLEIEGQGLAEFAKNPKPSWAVELMIRDSNPIMDACKYGKELLEKRVEKEQLTSRREEIRAAIRGRDQS